MTSAGSTALVVAVLFFATFIRSAFGFGEALVAVPLLALMMPVAVAAPVAVLVSITVAAVVVAQDWRHVHVGGASRLLVSTLAGIPLGLAMLTRVDERIVKSVLALVIVLFSAYSLIGRRSAALDDDRFAWLFGFGAGVLGGAYGMNGPPLAMYGTLRGWAPQRFRATLQGYFLPASLVGMAGYWIVGLWSARVTRDFVIALPAVAVAIAAGRAFNRRLSARSFLVYVHSMLVVVGFVLLWQAIV